jgi:hypothetical protein
VDGVVPVVRPWQPIREEFAPDKTKWELYNIDEDFSQANDLAKENPDKSRQLQEGRPSSRAGYFSCVGCGKKEA